MEPSPASATPPSTTPPSAPSPRRRWPVVVGWTALALAVLVLGVNLALSRFIDGQRLAGWVEPRLSAAVNRPADIGAVRVGIFPLGVRLEDVRLEDPTGLAPALASMESMDFRVRLLPLLSRRVVVRQIVVNGLHADLQVGEDGRTNFGDFAPAQDDPVPTGARSDEASPPPFALQLDEFRLLNTSLRYYDQVADRAVLLHHVDGRASLNRESGGPWAFDGSWVGRLSGNALPLASMRSEAGSVTGPWNELDPDEGIPLALATTGSLGAELEDLSVTEGTIALADMTLAVAGTVSRLKEPTRDVRLTLGAEGVPMSDVLSLVPASASGESWSGEGTAGLDLTLEGPLGTDTLPDMAGSVRVRDAVIRLGSTELARALDADVALEDRFTLRPEATGVVLDGETRVGGQLRLGPSRTVDLQVSAAPDLARIPAAFLAEGMSVTGRLPLDMRVAGNPAEPARLNLRGTLGVRNLEFRHPGIGVPVAVSTADLSLDGPRANLPTTGIRFGQDRVEVSGAFTGLLGFLDGGVPDFQGMGRGPRLDLVALSPDPPADTALTYGRVAFAQVGGRSVRGQTAHTAAEAMGLRRPAQLPLSGRVQVALDTVVDRRGRMEDVRADITFTPDIIQVTQAAFRRYGGAIRTTASLQLGSEELEPFSVNLQASGVDAGAFLSATSPLGRAVTGTLDLDLDLAGGLDGVLLPTRQSLQGTGSFALRGGGLELGALGGRLSQLLGIQALASPRIRDWSSGFVLRDGRILLQESTMNGAPGDPRVGGGIGLDGGLDLVTAFDLPRSQMAAGALERLGLPASTGDMVDAIVRVGGTLTDPAVRADPAAAVGSAAQAAAQSAAQAVEEQARTEVEERVQEQRDALRERATSTLRGLLGGRRAPADTVRVDTARTAPADSTRRDTLPPDTLRPDTTRPDTMRPDTSAVAGAPMEPAAR